MLEYILGIGGIFGGSLLTMAGQKFFGRLQKMSCYFIEDDVLSKIPQRDANGEITQNVHKKQFRLKNTTNSDISKFKVIFQFDMSSKIIECYSRSKEGIDHHRIKKDSRLPNQAVATVSNYNRGDVIDFYFTVVDVTENSNNVRESDAIGFKIICKDKRKKSEKSKASMSNTLFVNSPHQE